MLNKYESVLSKMNEILDMLRLSNHPIHLVSKGENYSPSAFIPFCAFGGNMSEVGTKSHLFDVPVCNIFQARILNDQLCYEADLKSISNKENIEKQLKSGFVFVMDYNEDRQIIYSTNDLIEDRDDFMNILADSIKNEDALIHLNTIGTVPKI